MPQRIGQLFAGKRLVDPATEHASHVPVLLGSNIMPQLFVERDAVKEGFLAQNTPLGWVVSGFSETSTSKVTAAHVASEEFEQKLINFWDMPISKEDGTELDEERCENLFEAKHYREEDRRYVN